MLTCDDAQASPAAAHPAASERVDGPEGGRRPAAPAVGALLNPAHACRRQTWGVRAKARYSHLESVCGRAPTARHLASPARTATIARPEKLVSEGTRCPICTQGNSRSHYGTPQDDQMPGRGPRLPGELISHRCPAVMARLRSGLRCLKAVRRSRPHPLACHVPKACR